MASFCFCFFGAWGMTKPKRIWSLNSIHGSPELVWRCARANSVGEWLGKVIRSSGKNSRSVLFFKNVSLHMVMPAHLLFNDSFLRIISSGTVSDYVKFVIKIFGSFVISMCIQNFKGLTSMVHQLLPSNQNIQADFAWSTCWSYTSYNRMTLTKVAHISTIYCHTKRLVKLPLC
jgi:hypothetical protein